MLLHCSVSYPSKAHVQRRAHQRTPLVPETPNRETAGAAPISGNAGDPTRYNKRVPDTAQGEAERLRKGAQSALEPVVERSAMNVRAVSQASTALAQHLQEASRAWLGLVQQTARTNLEAMSRLATCRTPKDFIALQANLARDNLQLMMEGQHLIAESTISTVQKASCVMQFSEHRSVGG
jgi:hypothetical protein